MKRVPERMCIVCRTMYPKNQLIRVVKSPEGDIEVDNTGKKPGRGAYICRAESCIKKATKTKAINKNLKTVVDSAIYEELGEKHNNRK